MKQISVAIDGPSGAGKSTLARQAAQTLGFLYVDTGAIFRSTRTRWRICFLRSILIWIMTRLEPRGCC